MTKIPFWTGGFLFLTIGVLSSCGKSDSAAYSADKPSTVMSAISSAVAVAGKDMGKGGSFRSSGARPNIDAECDLHSSPLNPANGQRIYASDADFPGRYFYCKMAKNSFDPESVQGSFSMVQSIACMLENAGIQFNGVAQTLTVTPNLTCFTQSQLNNMGTPTSLAVSVTGSAPAAFNTYFAKGAAMTVPGFGTFKIAANVSGSNVEFIAMEDQNDASTSGKAGVYAGALNTATGDLHFESRQDRFTGTGPGCSRGSCGFGRHIRIYSKLTMSGTTPTGIITLSGAAAEMYAAANGNPGSGYLVTASGALATGIKPLAYSANGNAAALNTLSSYTAGPNSRCYTNDTSTFSPCASTGIALPSSGTTFPFSHTVAGFVTPLAWMTSYAGMAFTAIDPSLDVQP